ncbi:Nn.00g057440.m01.CDS01 [Neocucurbitaria sp. VM-36]
MPEVPEDGAPSREPDLMGNTRPQEHSEPKHLTPLEADAITIRNQLESPLLRLPAEIRNSIYIYTLGGHRVRMGAPYTHDPPGMTVIESKGHQYPASKLLALSQTCRQTYMECGLQVHSLNEFGGSYGHDYNCKASRFEKCFMEKQRNAIRSVWIDFCHFECFGRIAVLQEYFDPEQGLGIPPLKLPGVERVTVRAQCMGEHNHSDHGKVRRLVVLEVGRDLEVTLEDRSLDKGELREKDQRGASWG